MAIPESQLSTWSHQGSVTQSANTYQTLKAVLEHQQAPYAPLQYSTFLQGSYCNDTNIFADSDVDIVIKLDSIFYRDISRLDEAQTAVYKQTFSDGSTTLADFRTNVAGWLQTKYGTAYRPGKKALYISASGARREVDVLPAAQFRRYYNFYSPSNYSYADGLCFFLPNGTMVENFPKQHSQNCTTKHQATSNRFKPNVRVWKNLRNKLIEAGKLAAGVAPSYYLEGLLYNVPNDKFVASFGDTFLNCLKWINTNDRTKLTTANKMEWLLRDNSLVSWNAAHCSQFLAAASQLWDSWGK